MKIFDGKTETAIFPGDLPGRTESAVRSPADGGICRMAPLRFVRFRPPKLERTAEGVTLSLAAYPARSCHAVPFGRPPRMTLPRKPAAFRLPMQAGLARLRRCGRASAEKPTASLAPRAVRPTTSWSFPPIDRCFRRARRSRPAIRRPRLRPSGAHGSRRLLVSAVSVIVSLAIGLWTDQLIRESVRTRAVAGVAGRSGGGRRIDSACSIIARPRNAGADAAIVDRTPARGRSAMRRAATMPRPLARSLPN